MFNIRGEKNTYPKLVTYLNCIENILLSYVFKRNSCVCYLKCSSFRFPSAPTLLQKLLEEIEMKGKRLSSQAVIITELKPYDGVL